MLTAATALIALAAIAFAVVLAVGSGHGSPVNDAAVTPVPTASRSAIATPADTASHSSPAGSSPADNSPAGSSPASGSPASAVAPSPTTAAVPSAAVPSAAVRSSEQPTDQATAPGSVPPSQSGVSPGHWGWYATGSGPAANGAGGEAGRRRFGGANAWHRQDG